MLPKVEIAAVHGSIGAENQPIQRAIALIHCGKRAHPCHVPLRTDGPRPESRCWGWNGNQQQPTITPSIFCNGEGGCGLHVNVVDGEVRQA